VFVALIAIRGSTSVSVFIVDVIGPGGGFNGPAIAEPATEAIKSNESPVVQRAM
jgi:hypothetical protein